MTDKSSDKQVFYGWINLVVMAGVGAAGGFYIVSLSYFLPALLKEFGWSAASVSWASTINMIALGLSGPVAGAFIMKFGARRAFALGNTIGFAGFFLLFFHSHLWQLYLGFGLLIGAGAGMGGMLPSTTVINNWFVKRRSLGLGLSLAAGGFANIFIGPAITAMIQSYGWRSAFLIISFIVLVLGVVIPSILVRNKPEDIGQIPDGYSAEPVEAGRPVRKTGPTYRTPVDFTNVEAVKTRCLWLLIGYYTLNMLVVNAIMLHQINYLVVNMGIDQMVASWALGLMSCIMAFSQLGTGFLGMRFSMHKIAVTAEIIKIIGIVILVTTDSLSLVFLYMVVLGLSFGGFIVAMMNLIPNYFGVTYYPKIMGFIRIFWAFIGGLGGPIAGFVFDETGSYLPAYKGAIPIAVIGLLCLILARPPVHPSLKVGSDQSK